jgi:hypothetical protein
MNFDIVTENLKSTLLPSCHPIENSDIESRIRDQGTAAESIFEKKKIGAKKQVLQKNGFARRF